MRKGEARGSHPDRRHLLRRSRLAASALDEYLPRREAAQAEPAARRGRAVDPARQDLPAPARTPAAAPTRTSQLAIDKLASAWNANPTSLELATRARRRVPRRQAGRQGDRAHGQGRSRGPSFDEGHARRSAPRCSYSAARRCSTSTSSVRPASGSRPRAQLEPADITDPARPDLDDQRAGARGQRPGRARPHGPCSGRPSRSTDLVDDHAHQPRGARDRARRLRRSRRSQLLRLQGRARQRHRVDAAPARAVVPVRIALERQEGDRARLRPPRREAKKANAQLPLAEIYAEWAPALVGHRPRRRHRASSRSRSTYRRQDPDIAPAAKRNLALALYRRGWKALHDGKSSDAAARLRACDPRSLGPQGLRAARVRLLVRGRAARHRPVQRGARRSSSSSPRAATRPPTSSGPYARAGSQFFSAYASYRNATGSARASACSELAKHEDELGAKVKRARRVVLGDTSRSTRGAAGSNGAAARAIGDRGEDRHGRSAPPADDGSCRAHARQGSRRRARGADGNPPESLVDLGILYDLLGRPKEAYDAWVRAKPAASTRATCRSWIDAKKRIYGF